MTNLATACISYSKQVKSSYVSLNIYKCVLSPYFCLYYQMQAHIFLKTHA